MLAQVSLTRRRPSGGGGEEAPAERLAEDGVCAACPLARCPFLGVFCLFGLFCFALIATN